MPLPYTIITGKIVRYGKYNAIRGKGHPAANRGGYVLAHRVIMEQHLGRLLTSKEIVHHKNEDKQNNAIDNLEPAPMRSIRAIMSA